MQVYNEALVASGVRVMAKGLYPSAEAIRISYPFEGETPIVANGPFPAELAGLPGNYARPDGRLASQPCRSAALFLARQPKTVYRPVSSRALSKGAR